MLGHRVPPVSWGLSHAVTNGHGMCPKWARPRRAFLAARPLADRDGVPARVRPGRDLAERSRRRRAAGVAARRDERPFGMRWGRPESAGPGQERTDQDTGAVRIDALPSPRRRPAAHIAPVADPPAGRPASPPAGRRPARLPARRGTPAVLHSPAWPHPFDGTPASISPGRPPVPPPAPPAAHPNPGRTKPGRTRPCRTKPRSPQHPGRATRRVLGAGPRGDARICGMLGRGTRLGDSAGSARPGDSAGRARPEGSAEGGLAAGSAGRARPEAR